MRPLRITLLTLAIFAAAGSSPSFAGAAGAGAFGPWSTAGALSLLAMIWRSATTRGATRRAAGMSQ